MSSEYPHPSSTSFSSNYQRRTVFRGRLCDPLWFDHEFLDNVCIFVSFGSRLNSKTRIPWLLVTVGVFCRLKTASKCTQTDIFGNKKPKMIILGTKKYFFLGEDLATSTTPTPSTATAPHSLLTKILNTPLPTTLPSLMFASPTAATLSYAYEILLIHRNKHANTCQNTRNHLHGGPHYKTCLQNHLLFS